MIEGFPIPPHSHCIIKLAHFQNPAPLPLPYRREGADRGRGAQPGVEGGELEKLRFDLGRQIRAVLRNNVSGFGQL